MRKFFIAIVGGTVLLVGAALIVLPGPAMIVIPAGLAILAIEFAWARRWLTRCKQWTRRMRERYFPRTSREASNAQAAGGSTTADSAGASTGAGTGAGSAATAADGTS